MALNRKITILIGVKLLKFLYQKQQADNERKVANELSELNSIKDHILANVSHELRTPLNGIIGLSESLKSNPENITREESQESLKAICQCGNQLEFIVNELLDFSQLQNKELILERKLFNIVSLANHISGMLQSKTNEHKLLIEIDFHGRCT